MRGYSSSIPNDNIIKRAGEHERGPLELSAEEFLTDMADLQCLPPTVQPRVSDHMDQIKNMIAKSSPSYRCLSGRNSEDNRVGEQIVIDPRKKNPADFALWKAAKDGEISWDSLWGKGRPGWHIECSAMSEAYLSEKFDIHGGGMDLIFPHHENEIAQNCAACPDSKIGYWMHNGFVTANNEKMSKSTGCWIMMTTSVGNNSVFRSFFEKQKLTGPNFIDWYRQLRLVLSTEDKENYFEHPIPAAPVAQPGQQVPPEALAAHDAWVKGQKEVVVLMLLTMDLDIQRNLAHLGAYDMLQELKAMFSK
ncbi:cysteine--tRNA ligase 2, cytoplasmic [Tanacetum coccineum]